MMMMKHILLQNVYFLIYISAPLYIDYYIVCNSDLCLKKKKKKFKCTGALKVYIHKFV